jgi:hypothetical protein
MPVCIYDSAMTFVLFHSRLLTECFPALRVVEKLGWEVGFADETSGAGN